MATERELRLRLTTKFDKAKSDINAVQGNINKLKTTMINAGGGSKKMKQEMRKLRIELSNTKIKAQQLGTALKQAGGGFRVNTLRKNTRVMNQLAYALDDVQYGFRGVQNNIQQMAILSGAAGPLVLAITALGIAANYVIEKIDWKGFFDTFRNGADVATKEAKKLKDELLDLTKIQLSQDQKIIISAQNTENKTKKAIEAIEKELAKPDLEYRTVGIPGAPGQTTQITNDGLSKERRAELEKELALQKESLVFAQIEKQDAIDRVKIQDELNRKLAEENRLKELASGREKQTTALAGIETLGTSYDQFKQWKRDMTNLVKSFALEWDIEWKKIGEITTTSGDELIEGIKRTQERLGHNIDTTIKKTEQLGQALQASITSAFVGLGNAIGDAILGEGDFGSKFLKVIGAFMQAFGAAIIAVGVAQLALELGLSTLNPALVIGGGVALVAAGAVLSGLASKGPDGKGGSSSFSAGTPTTTTPNSIQGFGESNRLVAEVSAQGLRFVMQAGDDSYTTLN